MGKLAVALIVVLLGLGGCANAPEQAHSGGDAVAVDGGSCLPERGWVVPASGEKLSSHQVFSRYGERDVVLLGEIHDSLAHHNWQTSVVASLASRGRNVVIGLEMLPRSAQPALDEWVAGGLSESDFLAKAGWRDYWRFDHELYMPILRLARLYRIPVYALNVERGLMQKIRERGWEGLTAEDREGLQDPASAPEDYRRMLAESFVMHDRSGGHGDAVPELTDERFAALRQDTKFQRFVQGQLVWDAAMAQRIAALRHISPDAQIIGIMGSGHMMDGHGVPYQLRTLGVDSVAVLVPWDDDLPCEMMTAQVADVVFAIHSAPPEAPSMAKPRLGIHIEDDESGVRVTKIEPGSIAESAGFNVDDVIVSIAARGRPKVADIVGTVQSMAPGTWLPVVVLRADHEVELLAKFPPTP